VERKFIVLPFPSQASCSVGKKKVRFRILSVFQSKGREEERGKSGYTKGNARGRVSQCAKLICIAQETCDKSISPPEKGGRGVIMRDKMRTTPPLLKKKGKFFKNTPNSARRAFAAHPYQRGKREKVQGKKKERRGSVCNHLIQPGMFPPIYILR